MTATASSRAKPLTCTSSAGYLDGITLAGDLDVVGDVLVIIVVYEVEIVDLAVDQKTDCQDKQQSAPYG